VSFLFEFNRGKAMKKVLLTTTALSIVAGVASAEITFSGSGEAGVYRTAPTAAAAAVSGYDAQVGTGNVDTTAGAYSAATDGTVTLTSGTAIAITAATGTATASTTTTIANALEDVRVLEDIVRQYQVKVDARGALDVDSTGITGLTNVATATGTTDASAGSAAADMKIRSDALVYAQAKLAEAQAVYDYMKGSAATAKGATPKLKAYSGYDFNVAASGTSDNGMTFAMGFDMGAGSIADQDDDRAMDAQAGAIDTSALTIGYAGYTIEIGDDKIDDLYDDSQNGDVSIAGSLGDLTFKLVTDMDDDVKAVGGTVWTNSATSGSDTLVVTPAAAAVYNPTSYSIGYTMGNVAFAMAGTEHDDRGNAAASMSLKYTVSDALSATLSSDNVGTYKDIAKVSVTSKISDALSITASVKDDKDHALNTNTGRKQSQDVSIAYSAGALSSTLATDEGSNWWVNAKYDLGGGATAFTTFDHTEFLVAGVNFKF